MKPKKQVHSACDDLFRMRLEQMLGQRHELYRLAGKIDWSVVKERFDPLYSEEGRPAIAIRLMAGRHYLKHTFNEPDETVVERWVENPCWQYFCGEEYFACAKRLTVLATQRARRLRHDRQRHRYGYGSA